MYFGGASYISISTERSGQHIMSAAEQNVTEAVEEGVAEIVEGQDALRRKVDARAAGSANELRAPTRESQQQKKRAAGGGGYY